VGLSDIDDIRKPHEDHSGCQNGFLYEKVGVVKGLFTGNSKSKRFDDIGFWDGSTAQVTIPRFYDGTEERVYVAPFDRFYLEEELVVPTWQKFVHHETGLDRLKYPVVSVEVLRDFRNESYAQDVDFTVTGDGRIQWGSRQPVPQLQTASITTNRGAVCAIRYRYRPFYYVGQLMHELRIAQVSNEFGRSIERLPQSMVVHREYAGPDADRRAPGDSGIDADALRTVLSPMSGGFGSR
jgi:hypothetical protein